MYPPPKVTVSTWFEPILKLPWNKKEKKEKSDTKFTFETTLWEVLWNFKRMKHSPLFPEKMMIRVRASACMRSAFHRNHTHLQAFVSLAAQQQFFVTVVRGMLILLCCGLAVVDARREDLQAPAQAD